MRLSPTWSGKPILANSDENSNVETFSVLATLISNDEAEFCVQRGRFSWRTAPEVSNMESVGPLGHKNGSYCFNCSPLHLNQVCMTCVENLN